MYKKNEQSDFSPEKSKQQFIYGIHPVEEAIKSGKEIEKIFLQNGLRNDAINAVFRLVREHQIPFQYVPVEKLNRLKPNVNHQGVIASLSNISYQPFEEVLTSVFEKGENPFFLILDRITDVRNIGAIARTAECTGVHAIIVPATNSALINSEAIKSSAGALLRIPICRNANLKNVIFYLKESGLQIVAATEKSSKDFFKVDFTKPTAVIMGSEEDGISNEYLKLSDERVKIPMAGEISSFNVSVACGIVLFEGLKQRL